jgi:ABC-2 type transport system permease protein
MTVGILLVDKLPGEARREVAMNEYVVNGGAAAMARSGSRVRREIGATVAILARDITLAVKSPSGLIMSFAMPLMMMGLIGGNLMQNMTGGLTFEFGPYMLVGMLVNILFMFTTMGMTSLVEDRATDFTQEMLVAPVSRYSIVIGKILGSSFGALISLIGTFIVALAMGITLDVGQWLALLALSPLMCLSGGALAMLFIGSIKSSKTANIVVMLVTMPQMFLSGVIIPITHSSGVLFAVSRALPMTYCVDLARSVVYAGTPEYSDVVLFPPAVSIIVVALMTTGFLVVGTWLFARAGKKR